jgi:ketosteroid isomerase-like protein
MVMFDVPPPVALRGIEAYRASWPDFFNWQRDANGSFDIHALDITAGTEVAFAIAILLCASEESRKKDSTPTLRLSIGLRKEKGRWLISHEHHSFPLER